MTYHSDLDSPIWGAENIGKEVNLSSSKAYWCLEQGYLPGTKIGKRWVSTKRKLRAAINGDKPVEAA
jgi:hypothetical protein